MSNIEKNYDFVNSEIIAIQAYNWKFVAVEKSNNHELVADRLHIQEWECFKLIQLGDNKIAFQAHNDKYVCAKKDSGEIVAGRKNRQDWEVFTVTQLGENKVALKSHHGNYVSVDSRKNGRLIAAHTTIEESEIFRWIPLRDFQKNNIPE
jgi:hypothetical protein